MNGHPPAGMSPDLKVTIDRIRISGASAALRDGPAFARALDRAVRQSLDDPRATSLESVHLSSVSARVRHDASIDDIASTIARKIAGTVGKG